ncbi:putative Predicted protein [[Clostridium] ultunense Esp]|nr:putative Predicted protein [[Clostridium] ultunense Esp]
MKREWSKWENEEGVTLVELLVVLAISSLLIGIVTMILLSSLMAFDRLTSDTELRNESNFITTVLNQTLKNVDKVEILDQPADPNRIYHFQATEVVKKVDQTEEDRSQEIYITGDDATGYNLFIGGKRINKEGYSLKGSYFWIGDGELKGMIQVEKIGSLAKPLYVYLSHPISG